MFTTDFSRYVDDHLNIMIFTNLGGVDSFPKHHAEKIAALYICRLLTFDLRDIALEIG